jgi:6-phosphogluconolactonase (cycloisomerase 2 family)
MKEDLRRETHGTAVGGDRGADRPVARRTGSNSISRYAIADDGSLSLLGSSSLGAATVGAEDARLAPDGRTLWVVDTGADAVSAFAVHGGDLTELPSSPTPLPAGAAPFGTVVT